MWTIEKEKNDKIIVYILIPGIGSQSTSRWYIFYMKANESVSNKYQYRHKNDDECVGKDWSYLSRVDMDCSCIIMYMVWVIRYGMIGRVIDEDVVFALVRTYEVVVPRGSILYHL